METIDHARNRDRLKRIVIDTVSMVWNEPLLEDVQEKFKSWETKVEAFLDSQEAWEMIHNQTKYRMLLNWLNELLNTIQHKDVSQRHLYLVTGELIEQK